MDNDCFQVVKSIQQYHRPRKQKRIILNIKINNKFLHLNDVPFLLVVDVFVLIQDLVFVHLYLHYIVDDKNQVVQQYSIQLKYLISFKIKLKFTNLSCKLPEYLVNFCPVGWWTNGAPPPGRPHGSYKSCWGIILKTFWPSLFGSIQTYWIRKIQWLLFYLPNKRNGSCASPLMGWAVPLLIDDVICLDVALPFAV
jgi:hypothetical protein